MPFLEQIRIYLRDHAGKIIDLFREWDEDGDGRVTKKEVALPRCEMHCPAASRTARLSHSRPIGGGVIPPVWRPTDPGLALLALASA